MVGTMFYCRIASGAGCPVYRCLKPALKRYSQFGNSRKFHNTNIQLSSINFDDKEERHAQHEGTIERDIKRFRNQDTLKLKPVADSIDSRNRLLENKRKQSLSSQDLLKLYPQPLHTLHNIYSAVSKELDIPNVLRISYESRNDNRKWHCTCTVCWPETKTFTSIGRNKQAAAASTALQCLGWLQHSGKIRNKKPVIYKPSEVKNITLALLDINLEPGILSKAKGLLDSYDKSFKSTIDRGLDIDLTGITESFVEIENSENVAVVSDNYCAKRNKELKENLSKMSRKEEDNLPVLKYREQILQELEKGQILVIKGETGSGKSTQVPRILMETFTQEGRATDCNVLISQPRRISAISLANRVADERAERVGDTVGYHVHLNKRLPPTKGGILYCTTGVLLGKICHNRNLDGYSHVILDEAHERTTEMDLLMLLLKRAVRQNPSLKLIVMSATINADIFQGYFDCPVINVPGRMYPVKMHFLEELQDAGVVSQNDFHEFLDFQRTLKYCDRIVKVIEWIAMTKPAGAILCFLPGWGEISRTKHLLEERPMFGEKRLVMTLHSKMSNTDQYLIFERPPPGVRKIILATEIAETGITIPDVIYVVDCCIRREKHWHSDIKLPSVSNQWISKANIQQRKGRAGRIQPGESYHLISKETYENLKPYPLPEITRSALEEAILEIKLHTDERAIDFLTNMLDTPKTATICSALDNLKRIGVLDHKERLTPLGERIVHFKIDPKLSKAMIYSTIFQCVDPVVGIASIFSKDNEMFVDTLTNKPAIRDAKRLYHPSSDHLAMYWICMQWSVCKGTSLIRMKDFCRELGLNGRKGETMHREFDFNKRCLKWCGMFSSNGKYAWDSMDLNKYSLNDELVRAVIYSGTNLLLQRQTYGFRKGALSKKTSELRANGGARASITTDSVNYQRQAWCSPFLTYLQEQHSQERRSLLARETSLLSPLSVLLFTHGDLYLDDDVMVESDANEASRKVALRIEGLRNVALSCDKETAVLLMKFKEVMWTMVNYLIKTYGYSSHLVEDDLNEVEAFKSSLMEVLSEMLYCAAKPINDELISKKK